MKKNKKYINRNKKYNHKNFCSPECLSASRVTSTKDTCANCGKSITIRPSLRRSKSGNYFCSKHCATVLNNTIYRTRENHPNFKNGESSYRIFAFKNLPNKCDVCGYDNINILQVHHLDSNRHNGALENLRILCPTHHMEIHYSA